METSIQVRRKTNKNSDLEKILNDKLIIPKFFRYSIKDEKGIGLIYELTCYNIRISENSRKIGTLYVNLMGPGERAKIAINLIEKIDESETLDFTFDGPIYRYLNLENKILLESLKKKIYEICTKRTLEDQGKISLSFLYKNDQINCEYSDEKHKQDVQELTTYLGCALKSKELSELIYYRLNLDDCKEMDKSLLNKRKTSKNDSVNYIV